jgi:hypothetical protein
MKVYSVNYVPTTKAYAFVISEETVTIRGFEVTEEAGSDATPAKIAQALNEHGNPLKHWIPERFTRYPGSMFMGDNDKSRIFKMTDQVCWQLDSNLLGKAACSDRSAWMFMDAPNGSFSAPFNRTLEFLQARASKDSVYGLRRENAMLTICQPYADSTLNDCSIFVKYSEEMGYHHNLGPTIVRVQGSPSPQDVWPRVRLLGPSEIAADGYATVDVEVLHPERDEVDARCNSTLYLEDVQGYCPNLRANVTQGRATFRVGALGHVAGDKVRIKVGWRNWPGETEYIATVT